MRVLHVIDKLNVGGAEKVFVDITHLLAEGNVAVDALLFDDTGEMTQLLDSRLKVHVLKRNSKFDLQSMGRLHRICSRYSIAHVHMRHVYHYVRLVQFLFRGKYTVVLHDHYGKCDIDRTIPFGLKYMFKPRHYIGVSKTLVEWARTEVRITPGNTFLLRNIIVPRGGSYASDPYNNKALIVSNLSRVKNIAFAIDLCKAMDWELDIYGNTRDAAYHQELVQQIGGSSKIRINSDVTDFSDVYSNYSLALHCAISESGPLVLLEYLAKGIPFIAFKTGEVAEVIYNDLPLLFMESFDKREWIERIALIKQTAGLPEKMREVFHRHFRAEKYADECLRIYEKIGC